MIVPAARRFVRALAALSLFGAGWLLGQARPGDGRTEVAGPDPQARVAVELTRASPGSHERIRQLALDPVRQTVPPPSAAKHVPPREIARRALASTVFLRGGNVYGAGVLLDDRGHVLTCDHVIDGLKNVQAWFDGDPTPIPVKIVARDHDADLALLTLGKPHPRGAAKTASIADVAMGDEVFAMGAPRKMTFSMSHGIVSYVGRSFDGTFYVQTDLAANPGSSGGPIMNDRGDLIGVSSFILRGSQGLTFAVPIDYAYKSFSAELGEKRDSSRFDKWLESRKAKPDTRQTG